MPMHSPLDDQAPGAIDFSESIVRRRTHFDRFFDGDVNNPNSRIIQNRSLFRELGENGLNWN